MSQGNGNKSGGLVLSVRTTIDPVRVFVAPVLDGTAEDAEECIRHAARFLSREGTRALATADWKPYGVSGPDELREKYAAARGRIEAQNAANAENTLAL